jgi:CheY-like chemotaxis protein
MSSLPQKKQILIVDDNQDIRLLLAQVLEEEYIYTIWLAKNGVEAIAQATQVHPDLILLDMSLPGMSGLSWVGIFMRPPGEPKEPPEWKAASASCVLA